MSIDEFSGITKTPPTKAWLCEVYGFEACVTWAHTRGQARANVVLGMRDAGYGNRRGYWPNVSATRAKEFDGHIMAHPWRRRVVSLDYARTA